MDFSDSTIKKAFANADGECEECGEPLVYGNRQRDEDGAWHAHHKNPVSEDGSNSIRNCQILCIDCHDKVHYE